MAEVDVHPVNPARPAESTVIVDTVSVEQPEETHKQPKRVLHFSDGVLEEYSDDDSEEEASPIQTKVDPRMLTWTPWCLYYVTMVARKSLSAAELCGEKLAWFFGITSPKYGYALEEYKRMERENESERLRDQKLFEESQGLSAIEIHVRDGRKPGNTNSIDLKNATEKY
ncbi:hypothetical protein BsWGS_10815 [Bradybaena similaris]